MSLILMWIVNAIALLLIARFLPGFQVSSFYSAMMVVLILGLLNVTVKPIVVLLTLPVNILTLGLFTFVINALMLSLVSTIVKGFEINTFTTALLAALILWAINFLTQRLLDPKS
jgi:putative membrane protein